MKTFSKPAILIIALLSFTVVALSYSLVNSKKFYNPTNTSVPSDTTDYSTYPISWCDAINTKHLYQNSNIAKSILTDGKIGIITKTGLRGEPLKGWRLNLDKIAPLLEKWKKDQLDELFLVPVMKPTTNIQTGRTTVSTSHMSIIVAGIYNNNIVYDSTDKQKMLFEYLKPCPNNCPDNYDKLFKNKPSDLCPPIVIKEE